MPSVSLSPAGAGLVSYKTSDPADVLSSEGLDFQEAFSDFTDLGETLTLSLEDEEIFKRRHARLRRNVWFAGNAITRTVPHGWRCWMVTLTYRDVDATTPRDLSKALHLYRKWTRKRGCKVTPYLWVAELQKRGAVHYHLLVWLPKHLAVPKWDKQGWWKHGSTQRIPVRNAVGYAMKYVSKWSALYCRFPAGLRIYGSGGLELSDRRVRQWSNLPGWARAEFGVGQCRRIKGGLCDMSTGELLQPRYSAVKLRRSILLVKLIETKPRWYDGPYSNISESAYG